MMVFIVLNVLKNTAKTVVKNVMTKQINFIAKIVMIEINGKNALMKCNFNYRHFL